MKPKLKNVFLAGLAVTVPVGLTIYILIFLIELMDGLLRVVPAGLHPEQILVIRIPGLGVIATLILIFIAGRGDILVRELSREQPELLDCLAAEDISICFKNRVANLQKIFPYLPDSLNRVLRHFSTGRTLRE